MTQGDTESTNPRPPDRREDVRQIANRLLVTWGLPLLVLAVLSAGLFFFRFTATEKTTVWWFVVAVVVLAVAFVQGQVFNARSKALYEDVREELRASSTKTKEEVKKIVEENVDPRVTVLRSLQEVRAAAAKLIEEAVQNKSVSEVHYFGSASLTPSEHEYREASHSETHDVSDIVRYQNALNDLKNSSTKVTRFIRLLEDDRFSSRDPKTRGEYLLWLQYQVARLKVNPNYVLYDSRRAPEWGGPRSSIVTINGILDIIGDGGAGLLTLSARIPSVLLYESKKYFWAARLDQNKPQPYATEQAHELQCRVDALKELHQERLAVEGKFNQRKSPARRIKRGHPQELTSSESVSP